MRHDPDLAELVNSLELGGQGTTVSVGLTVSPALIDLLGTIISKEPAPAQVPGAVRSVIAQAPTL